VGQEDGLPFINGNSLFLAVHDASWRRTRVKKMEGKEKEENKFLLKMSRLISSHCI